jgi:hypothetical protein
MIELIKVWEYCCKNLRGEFEYEYVSSVTRENTIKLENRCGLKIASGNGYSISFHGPDKWGDVSLTITREEYERLQAAHIDARTRVFRLKQDQADELARKYLAELLNEIENDV